ncbi:TIGR03364 family FAD-dependent oxidoreductase [Glutamicibacter endophyticus]
MNFYATAVTSTAPSQADVLVVGSGIIGLAHAALAAEAGHRVILLERDHRPVGASVRNFGHACITAQHGEIYELAQASRRHWLHFSERAGFWASPTGSVVIARSEVEIQVLREFSASRPQGQVSLLNRSEVLEQLRLPAETPLIGGAFLCDDLRVDPRTAAGSLNLWLAEHPHVEVLNGTAATNFAPGTHRRHAVHTTRGTFEADQVFVCVGHDVDYLFPQIAKEHNLVRCALQMVAAKPTEQVDVTPAVLTGTSMLRYDAFSHMTSYPQLQREISANQPELMQIGANVMYTQRPDGTFLLGDSHSYASTQPPFLQEDISNVLLGELAKVLPATEAPSERWQGVYASSTRGPLLIRDLRDGLTIVSVTSGIGMTIGFGLAEANLKSRVFTPSRS